MDKNTITLISDNFENGENGETVRGITIIIDGTLKQVMDLLIEKNPDYLNYMELTKEALFEGVSKMIEASK